MTYIVLPELKKLATSLYGLQYMNLYGKWCCNVYLIYYTIVSVSCQ